MKLKKVLAGLMAAATAVTVSVCGLSVSAGASFSIPDNAEIIQSGKETHITLQPRRNLNTSETAVYCFNVSEKGKVRLDYSSETYYVSAEFDSRKSMELCNVDVNMSEGQKYIQTFRHLNDDIDYVSSINFIWDYDTEKCSGYCEFELDPGEYYVGFTAYYDSKGNGDVPFEKIKDEFGNGKITVKMTYPSNGKQNNSSNESTSFKISDLDINPIKNQAYSGKAIKPTVTVKDGDKKLVNGTDYTVTYKNNTNIGTATVTIIGKGDYTGTKTLTFKIVPKKVALTGKASGAKETLSWKKSAGATGYVVYRSVDGGKFTKLATTKSLKYTAKLTSGKKYQFKVRPYTTVNGSKVYGSWSNIVSAN